MHSSANNPFGNKKTETLFVSVARSSSRKRSYCIRLTEFWLHEQYLLIRFMHQNFLWRYKGPLCKFQRIIGKNFHELITPCTKSIFFSDNIISMQFFTYIIF